MSLGVFGLGALGLDLTGADLLISSLVKRYAAVKAAGTPSAKDDANIQSSIASMRNLFNLAGVQGDPSRASVLNNLEATYQSINPTVLFYENEFGVGNPIPSYTPEQLGPGLNTPYPPPAKPGTFNIPGSVVADVGSFLAPMFPSVGIPLSVAGSGMAIGQGGSAPAVAAVGSGGGGGGASAGSSAGAKITPEAKKLVDPSTPGPGKTPAAITTPSQLNGTINQIFGGLNSTLAQWFQFRAMERMAQGKPVYVPGKGIVNQAQASMSWTPIVAGGLVLATVGGIVYFITRRKRK